MFNRKPTEHPFGMIRRMRATIGVLAAIVMSAVSAADIITNDTFWQDTSGNNIYSQGGGVFKFGNTYYWYGVKYEGAVAYAANPWDGKIEDTTFQAVTCYSSTDLVNWTFENEVLTPSTAGLGDVWWLGRLGVARNPNTGRYVLCAQLFGTNAPDGALVFASGSSPTGDFRYERVQVPPGVANNMTGDQTVFIDDDGQAYLICSSAQGRSNWYVARFRPSDYLGIETAVRIGGGAGREGNCMFKRNGVYYLCSSDLYGWNASRCYYRTATNIFGPYSSENIMANSEKDFNHVTQTGFFVTVPGSQNTTVIFAGDRWAAFAGNGLGYNQWNPLSFNGTTPIFNSFSEWDFDEPTGNWSVGAGNNYALNPSYEANRVRQSWASGWSSTANTGQNGGDGDGRTGDFFYEHWSSGSYSASTDQVVEVPNGTYELSVWFRSSGGQSTSRMFARDYGGSQRISNLNTSQGSWAQRTISNINVTNGQIRIGIESTASGGQWVNFEDWELIRVGGCTPTSITPYLQVNGGSWQGSSSATLDVGDSIRFGPQPVSGGSWSWSGPNGFSSSSREVLISNIQPGQGGIYTATYTNSGGCESTHAFAVTVNGGLIADGTYQIVARHSGKALDAAGSANNTNVLQYEYWGGANQQWVVTHLGNNVYTLVGAQSGRALDAVGTGDGGNVQLYDYWGGANQEWTILPTSGGYYRLTPTHAPSMSLDVNAISTADGANVQIWTYLGGNNQQWTFQAP